MYERFGTQGIYEKIIIDLSKLKPILPTCQIKTVIHYSLDSCVVNKLATCQTQTCQITPTQRQKSKKGEILVDYSN